MEEEKKNIIIQPTDPQSNTQKPAEVNQSTNSPHSDPISSSQLNQYQDNKSSKWRYFFVLLGILQALGIAVFFLIMFRAIQQAKAGVPGTEFIGLILFVTLVPAVGIIALINLIGLPIYMTKFKPHGKGLVLAVISLVISVILFLYGAYSVYQIRVTIPRQIDELSEQSKKESEQREQEFAVDNANPEITKEEAISFMQDCKADYFVGYTDIGLVKDSNTKSWLEKAEQSSSGIEISEGSTSYVFVSKSMTTELQDTARQFRQSCYNTKKLYIAIDDWIETEYPAGQWSRVKQ